MLPLLLLIPLFQGGTNDSGGVLIPEQSVFDVLHYTLDLDVDPDAKSIAGSLTMRARAVEGATRIALDLDGRLAVSEVRSGEVVLAFVHESGRIWIDFPGPLAAGEEFEVRVAYGGQPRVAPRPPWDGGFTWKETKAKKPWIATSCQGEGADLWWPCKDHPSDKADTMDIVVTVPKGLICASNGTLVSEEKDGGHVTFHWKSSSPISNYNVALNIAPYEVIESKFESVGGETVPVYFYALPEDAKKAKKALKEFIDHLRFFEELLGPYPFRAEKYGVAQTPHLGMEHQTIIAYGYDFKQDRGYDWLHHHELSHEWWANLVTCADWKDMWIHEGFGTYMQALYMEELHGPEGLRAEIAGQRRGINNRRPVAPRETHSSKEIYFAPDGSHDNDIYNKGSLVLHTLRWTIGDEAFFESLRRMCYPDPETEKVTDGSQVRFADTEDYRTIVEGIAETDLAWFFEVYLRQPKLPKLVEQIEGRELRLRWDVPVEVDFPLPVPVRLGGAKGKVVRVDMPGGTGVVQLPGSKKYTIDPDLWVLRE